MKVFPVSLSELYFPTQEKQKMREKNEEKGFFFRLRLIV